MPTSSRASHKEPLLVSKALPVSRPHTTSAPLATYHFCARLMISALTLRIEAFRLSLYGLRISKSPLVYVSSLKFTDGPGACRLSFERVLDAIISRSSE